MPKKDYESEYVRRSFRFDGRRYFVRGRTEEEALRKQIEKERQLAEGFLDSNSTVRKWASIWLETYVDNRDIIDASRRMYHDKVNNIILPAIGAYKLRTVTATQLQQLLNTRAGYSTSDTGKLRIVIKAMFRQAAENRLIPHDPSTGLKMPRTVTGKHRSLTDAERAALIRAADTDRFDGKPNNSGLWVLSILYCGLRPGETAALRWEDIDLATGTLHIRAAKESHSKSIKAPKTDAGVRDIPIPKEYLARLQAAPHRSEFVFTQRDGKTPLTDSSMKRMWETIKKYMDLELGAKTERIKPKGRRKHKLIITHSVLAEDLDLYCLRHTYCTDLQSKGVPINIAKELMGHADISTTANIYTHSTADSLQIARNLINA